MKVIWDLLLTWIFDAIYSATASFFYMIGSMGAEIFDLKWVQSTVQLFKLFGWGLFVAGLVVAVFDLAIEYQNGRGNIRTTSLNILKGFFACSLISVVPIELYKFAITLQYKFTDGLTLMSAYTTATSLTGQGLLVMKDVFSPTLGANKSVFTLFVLIAFAYIVVKVFFQNIKRGGILLIQISVGSLYMFSVPRGYTDGFTQWCKQVVALCLTAFMQTTLLFMGFLTFSSNMILGLGIMLAAGEVPKIAQQFGMDTSTRFSMMNVVHATTTAINLTRIIAKK